MEGLIALGIVLAFAVIVYALSGEEFDSTNNVPKKRPKVKHPMQKLPDLED